MTVTVHFSDALGLHAEFRTAADEIVTLRPENKFDPSAASSRAAKMVFKSRKDSTDSARFECGTEEAPAREREKRKNRRHLRTQPEPTAGRELQSQNLPNCEGDLWSIGDLVCNPSLNNADCAYDAGDCCSIYKTCDDAENCECIDPEQNAVPHREYRLAITATKKYVDFYENSTEAILASYAMIVGRVNRFFMREMSTSFVVIPEVVDLFDRDGTRLEDSQDGAGELSPAFISSILAEDLYDIGHMFGDYPNGLGYYNAVCSADKGRGGSGVLAFEYGEWLVAHEFGHQFGAYHTWSHCWGPGGSGVEAGSGKSIMSYGGTCGEDNVDADRDTFFHSFSLAQMAACVKNPLTCGACATIKPDPVLQAPVVQTDLDAETAARETTCRVPLRTPFRLEARRGERSRGLFYSWEQSELRDPWNTYSSITDAQTDSTILFSSDFPQRDVLTRTFPRIDMVRRGMDTVDPRERLPDLARTIPFTMLVRTAYLPEASNDFYDLGWGEPVPEADGIPVPTLGATFLAEEVVVQVIDEEPLRVANVSGPVLPGAELQVQWTGAQRTTERVRILLSLDDGETFPVLLAADVANADGAAVVAVPQLPGCGLGFARVRVESLDVQEGCSFFAMNDNTLAVDGCDTTGTTPPPVPDWPLFTPLEAIALGPGPGRFDHKNRRGADVRLDGYENNTRTSFVFTAPENHQAGFVIREFNTEEGFDYVAITDPRNGYQLWWGSGNLTRGGPIAVRAPSNVIKLEFNSDHTGTRSGFVVDFESISTSQTWSPTAQPTLPLGPGPGRFDQLDRRDDAARRDWYDVNVERKYVLEVEASELAQFTIIEFDTEEGFDIVTITDPSTGDRLWEGSGNLEAEVPITIVGSTNQLELLWVSDEVETRSGFVIGYSGSAASTTGRALELQDDTNLRETLWSTGGSAEVTRKYVALPGESVVVVTPSLFMAEAGNVSFFDGDGSLLHRVTAADDVLAFPVSSKSDTMTVEAGGLAGAEGELTLLVRGLEAASSPTSSPTVTASGGGGPSPVPSPEPSSEPSPSPSPIDGLSMGAFAGILAGGAAVVVLAGAGLFMARNRRKPDAQVEDGKIGGPVTASNPTYAN